MSSNIKQVRSEVEATTHKMKDLEDQTLLTERVLLRYMALGRRMGMPDNLASGFDLMARGTVQARQMTIALQQLQMAYVTGGPLAWALGLASLGIWLFTMKDMVDSAGSYL